MMTRTFASVAVMAALGLLTPIHANAFGLGKLELSSALNEPLRAEIAITALKGDDADNLQVRLASKKEFEQAGIERNFLLTQLKFDVIEKSGSVKIVISSQQAIREPFIDFLLTATTTSSGRLIREYTVLLDPPKSIFKKAVATSVQSPDKTSAKTSVSTNSDYKTTSFDGNSYGPVTRTDTLWDVALKTRPESNITIQQMMIALLKENPTAFQHNNVNGLKAGYTLSIPSNSDIYKLTKRQASNAFSEQNALWKNRNTRPSIDTEISEKIITPKAEVAPTIAKVVTTEITEPVTELDDTAHLELVVPSDQTSLNDDALSPLGAEKIKVLSEQLTLAQETIEGQTQENIDFKARMDALEVQMETMRRLISLKDADLARLQSMLEKNQKPDEITPPTDTAVIENADIAINIKPLGTPLLGEEVDASQSDSITDIDAIEDELESLFVMAQKIVANNKVEMAIGAGSLLLLLVLLLFIKRRKEDDDSGDNTKNLDNDDEKLSTDQPSNFDEDKLEKVHNVAQAQQTVEPVVIDKKTIAELIEQADILVAYAEYEKAIALLEEAKQQEPTNQLLLIKLLFVMFKLQLKDPFVTLAGSLNIDKDSAEWLEIAEWGKQLAPSNTLFHLVVVKSEPAATPNLDAFSTAEDGTLSVDEISDKEVDKIEANISDTIEFNLDDYATNDASGITDSSAAAFDELNDNDDESLKWDTAASLDDANKNTDFDAPLNFEVESESDESTLSLNDEPLSLDLTEQTYEAEVLPTDDNYQDLYTELDIESEDSSLEFDISGYDEIDEAETKLDLASAYADMGDPDGARNILEEVLKEGNDEQKSKAQALLKNLS
ncbi:MAG: pilus assembly protein FimV [Methylophagaceae bacterium]|jgi:pilus assembly protein FimV